MLGYVGGTNKWSRGRTTLLQVNGVRFERNSREFGAFMRMSSANMGNISLASYNQKMEQVESSIIPFL